MGRADGVEKEAREVLHVAGAVGRRADPTANGYPVRVPIHALMRLLAAIFLLLLALPTSAQERGLLLVPDRVFDGEAMQEGWAVLVRAEGDDPAAFDILTRSDLISALARAGRQRG